jgi:hypothetical protein
MCAPASAEAPARLPTGRRRRAIFPAAGAGPARACSQIQPKAPQHRQLKQQPGRSARPFLQRAPQPGPLIGPSLQARPPAAAGRAACHLPPAAPAPPLNGAGPRAGSPRPTAAPRARGRQPPRPQRSAAQHTYGGEPRAPRLAHFHSPRVSSTPSLPPRRAAPPRPSASRRLPPPLPLPARRGELAPIPPQRSPAVLRCGPRSGAGRGQRRGRPRRAPRPQRQFFLVPCPVLVPLRPNAVGFPWRVMRCRLCGGPVQCFKRGPPPPSSAAAPAPAPAPAPPSLLPPNTTTGLATTAQQPRARDASACARPAARRPRPAGTRANPWASPAAPPRAPARRACRRAPGVPLPCRLLCRGRDSAAPCLLPPNLGPQRPAPMPFEKKCTRCVLLKRHVVLSPARGGGGHGSLYVPPCG